MVDNKYCPKCLPVYVDDAGGITILSDETLMKEDIGYLWIEQEKFIDGRGNRTKTTKFLAYTCSKCGYTELYKE